MERYVARPCSAEVAELGEGARWDGQGRRLLWVDIPAGRLFCAEFRDNSLVTTTSHEVPGYLGAVAPIDAADGGWIIAAHEGFAHLSADGDVTVLAEPEAGKDGRIRMNDGACDPAGRFWAGSMAYDSTPFAGSLYRYDGDGQVTRVLSEVSVSNGLGWSPDGTRMYYADSGTHAISVFDYDLPAATVANRRTFATVDPAEGVPDGLCVDREGFLWVAIWGGGQARRYSPDGDLVAVVQVAARQPSSCALGGPVGRHLFITTARVDLAPDILAREPDTGRVFVAEVAVPGPPARPYVP